MPDEIKPDEFAAAFAEFTEPTTGAAAMAAVGKTPEEIAAAAAPAAKTPEEIAAAAAPAAKTPEEIVAEAAAAAPAIKTPEEIAAEAAAAAAPVVAEPDPAIAELQRQLAELRTERAATPVAPAPAAAEKPLYAPEELTALEAYHKDWPDVAKGEALARRAEYRELVAYVFQQVEAKYAPALEYMEHQAPRTQLSAIVELVPDYAQVRDATLAWVEKQPTTMRAAFEQVTQDGSPEDVAGLIALFKKDTGYVAPVATVTEIKPAVPAAPAAPVKPAAPALPAATQAAAAKLAVVQTGRTDQTSGTDDNDFTGAFAKYAEAEEKQAVRK